MKQFLRISQRLCYFLLLFGSAFLQRSNVFAEDMKSEKNSHPVVAGHEKAASTVQEFSIGKALIELRVVPDNLPNAANPKSTGTMVVREMLCSADDIERLVTEQNSKNAEETFVTLLLKDSSVARVHEISGQLVSKNIGLYRDGALLKTARLVEGIWASIQLPIATKDVPQLVKNLRVLPPPEIARFRKLLLERKEHAIARVADGREKIFAAHSLIAKKQYKEAIELLAPLEQNLSEEEIPAICLVLGNAYRVSRRAEEATRLYERCLEKSKKAWSVGLELSEIYAERKEFEKAYLALKRYNSNLERSLNISALRTQLQTLSTSAETSERKTLLRDQIEKQLRTLEAAME